MDQINFVQYLVDKDNQITGFRLVLNRLLILFRKCLFLRRKRKLVTFLEIFGPILLFYFYFIQGDKFFGFSKKQTNSNLPKLTTDSLNIFFNNPSKSKYPLQFQSQLYYDFNNQTVNVDEFDKFLNKINQKLKPEFERYNLGKPNETENEGSLLAYFKEFNSRSINYEIKAFNLVDYYKDWFRKDQDSVFKSLLIDETEVEILNDLVLQTFTENSISNYSVDPNFLKINFTKKSDQKIEANQTKFPFPNFAEFYKFCFVTSFTFNFFYAIVSVCNEKKNRSYEFLKLMTASDTEIYLSYFLDHFLIWLIPCLVNFLIFWCFVSSALLPFSLAVILIIFSILFVIHYIIFIFLLSSPFRKHLLAEAFYIFIVIMSTSFLEHENDTINLILFLNPYCVCWEFTKIFKNSLALRFNFKENFFTIFAYSSNKQMSLFNLLIISIIAIAIEIALTHYILQVNPFQNSIRKPFLYFFSSSYWRKPETITDYITPQQKEFEKPPSAKTPTIILKDVNKSYSSCFNPKSKSRVLNNFNFAIYNDQITVLLGHNGAGKTTMMNLITGLSNPDSGTISVKGIPVTSFSNDYKNVLGYCPQENIFYETLTVYQNIQIASILKGVSWNSSKSRISKLAEQFDLKSKLNESAQNLSGGMKRRLCLAMALTGFNDVLVIDEPTSGLDPENRRKVWDILLLLRKYRTILLTTHFMEEADILGDSIAIMYKGKVRCCGSTLFLKKLYHVGYLLRLESSKDIYENDLMNLMQKYIPNAIYENRNDNEHFIRLISNPDDKDHDNENLNMMLVHLLEIIDSEDIKKEFGIRGYGLTNTSLEDVFIKTAALDHETNEYENSIDYADSHPLYRLNRIEGPKLYFQQFYAIMIKKFMLSCKNLQLFVSSLYLLFLPVLFISLITWYLKSGTNYDNLFKIQAIESFNLKQLPKIDKMEVLLLRDSFSTETDLFRDQNHEWLTKEFGFKLIKSNQTNIELAIRDESERLGYDKMKNQLLFIPVRKKETTYEFHIGNGDNLFNYPILHIGILEMFYRLKDRNENAQLKPLNINLRFEMVNKNDSEYELRYVFFLFESILLVFVTIMFGFPFIGFIIHLHDEMNSEALQMQIIAGLSKTLYWLGNLIFDYMSTILIMILSCVLMHFSDNYQILSKSIFNIFGFFALACLNCLLIVYFITNLNLSREYTETIIKYSFIIAAISIGATSIIYQLVFYSFSQTIYELNPSIVKLSLPYLFFWKSFSPIYNMYNVLDYYLLQFMVIHCIQNKRIKNCENLNLEEFNLKENLFAFLISSLVFGFIIILINCNAKLTRKFLDYLNRLIARLIARLMKKREQNNHELIRMNESIVDFNFISTLENIEDPNVQKEKNLVDMLIETNNLQSNILVIHQLYKLFDHLEAVNHISFTVKREECFGLLGINGAGKTTTFRLIGGCISPTSGLIILDENTCDNKPYEYYRKLGYCPQQNIHTKKLSVLDNLKFYARINGIPENLVQRTVEKLIEECDLEDYQYKNAEKLSGGNKRKLSTAISLIGGKELILLDEPTTGVDPIARRKLWRTIEYYKKKLKTSFVLTSHSMDEVEKLCSKISIMVNGKFKALGTFSYLKNRYSQGFTITIKIKDSVPDRKNYVINLKNRMIKDFNNNAHCKEYYMNTLVFILPKTFKWINQFLIMEKIKKDFDLDDYLIQETNLEQIFLSFANK